MLSHQFGGSARHVKVLRVDSASWSDFEWHDYRGDVQEWLNRTLAALSLNLSVFEESDKGIFCHKMHVGMQIRHCVFKNFLLYFIYSNYGPVNDTW